MTITNIPTAIMTDKEKRIREDRRSHSIPNPDIQRFKWAGAAHGSS